VFGDLNIKIPGKFYLRFNLFEMQKKYVTVIGI